MKKNSLCITQCRTLLLDHISLEKMSVSSKKQTNKQKKYCMNLFLIGLHWLVPLPSWGWSAIVTFPCVACRWLGVNSGSKEVWQFSGVLKVAAAVLWHTYVCFGWWWWVAMRSAALWSWDVEPGVAGGWSPLRRSGCRAHNGPVEWVASQRDHTQIQLQTPRIQFSHKL